jgi:glyoxylate/hydroxypyruvate reductase A
MNLPNAKPPIAVIGSISESELDAYVSLLNQGLPSERFVSESNLNDEQKAHCDIAIVANPSAEQLSKFPSLIWVHSLWAGVEKLSSQCTNSTFKIVRLVDPSLSKVMSEAVLAWTLYLHRNMPAYAKQQTQRVWSSLPYRPPESKTIGILGIGELGKASALRLAENGFKVIGWSRHEKAISGIHCYHGQAGLDLVLKSTDILISLLPLTPSTHHVLGRKNLAKMKKNSAIINFSRGPIIDAEALLNQLDSGHISHAVLDVFDEEPLAQTSPLWEHEHVTVLPHISAPTQRESACNIVINNIKMYRQNGTIAPHIDTNRGY